MNSDLNLNAAADAASVGRARERFAGWLRRFELDSARHNDIVLAVNEALANSAEFAYLHTPDTGAVSLQADHDRAESVLTVQVRDEGHWREPHDDGDGYRGRGIPLMRALADLVSIVTVATGTTVCLRFGDVALEGSAVRSDA